MLTDTAQNDRCHERRKPSGVIIIRVSALLSETSFVALATTARDDNHTLTARERSGMGGRGDGSPAQYHGLEAGDVILAVNGRAAYTPFDVQQAMSSSDGQLRRTERA